MYKPFLVIEKPPIMVAKFQNPFEDGKTHCCFT